MAVREFALKYKEQGYPRNLHPWTGQVVVTDVSASSLVYVDGLYSVEEYFLFPNSSVPAHHHPCDTVTIFLGGDFFGLSIGGSGSGSKKYSNKDFGEVGGILIAGNTHGALMGDKGAVSLVVAQWDNIDQMNSAAIEWYGNPSGPIHAKLLSK